MTTLMRIGGALLALLGLVLTGANFLFPGQMQVMGLTFSPAFTLLAGGMIAMGLGGVVAAIEAAQGRGPARVQPEETAEPAAPVIEPAPLPEPAAPVEEARAEVPDAAEPPAPAPSTPEDRMAAFRRERFPGFTRHLGDAAGSTVSGAGTVAAATAAAATAAAQTTHDSVADTIAALEKAKSDINAALGEGGDTLDHHAADEEPEAAAPEEAPAEEAGADDGELYVVEEKIIRGRPARVLSDGTVEAETDEGWMRFENFDHLDEYLDATGPELRS